MRSAVYILVTFFCIQGFAFGQSSEFDQLIDSAVELAEDDPSKSIELTQKAFKLASRARDIDLMVSAKTVMGYIGMVNNDYETSYINYNDALEYWEKGSRTDLYEKVSILNNLAIIKSSYEDHAGAAVLYKLAHQTAIKYISENREEAEEYGDLQLLIDLPYETAVELKNDGQYFEAGEILVDLWEQSEFKKDTILLARVVNQLGLIKKRNKEFNKALDFFAVAAFNDKVEPSLRGIAMHNLAETYMDQEDYTKAEKYFAQAFEIKQQDPDDKRSMFITLLYQGELEYLNGNKNEAISNWESALSTYDQVKNEPDLFIVYDWLQKAYLEENLQKSAMYGNLYTSNIRDWMDVQQSQVDATATLQAFNTQIDTILSDRQAKAERMALLKRYWPFAVMALLVILLFVYMVQLALNRRREQVLERDLRSERAVRADQILDKIRRD